MNQTITIPTLCHCGKPAVYCNTSAHENIYLCADCRDGKGFERVGYWMSAAGQFMDDLDESKKIIRDLTDVEAAYHEVWMYRFRVPGILEAARKWLSNLDDMPNPEDVVTPEIIEDLASGRW